MFDPIFDLLAGLLSFFYSIWPSYGFAIIALTFVVLLAFTPLTYKSTKSIVAMRRLQPSIKRIQKKHAGDREAMNQEMMKLYQEHSVSPLSGCLPILIQSPVFIVLFRVVRGITRRSSDIGFRAGESIAAFTGAESNFVAADSPERTFNPEFISEDTDLYMSLVDDSEMLWLSVDLSRTPLDVVRDSFSSSFPYLLMIAIVALLGWYQQRQIAGRSGGEISSQQQMIMRVLPWMLPIFSFTMPAGLVLYFIVSALLRVAQQAYITRTVYGDEELTAPLELDDDPEFDDDDEHAEPENPLAQLFGGPKKAESTPSARHGSRRPTSSTARPRHRTRPPRDTPKTAPTKEPRTTSKKSSAGSDTSSKKRASSTTRSKDTATGWGKAKRSAKNEAPERPVSRRVTPKREDAPNNRRKKK